MTFLYLRTAMVAGFVLVFLSPLAARANTPEQIFVQVSPSVLVVDIFDAKGKSIGQGSGAVIGVGQVITNCHVAQKGESLKVRRLGKTFKATIQYADPDRDLCQLSVPDLQVQPVILGTAKELRVGQRVYAIGAPKGLELTLSEGLISSLRPYEGSQYIQTSAAISPGSSGGGLFDDQGRLIGITTFQVIDGQNLNFALPVDWVAELPKRKTVLGKKDGGLNWFNRALVLERKQDWEGLIKLSQRWVKSEPGNVEGWRSLGDGYFFIKQYQDAIKAYREALRIQPDYFRYYSTWSRLGLAYDFLKKYDQAIGAYREALRINPNDFSTWHNLGNAYKNLKQYDKAIRAYREVVRIQPFFEAWTSLGKVYFLAEQYDQAVQPYQEALRIRPEDADTWYALGLSYYATNQYDQAIPAYREALRIQPENAAAWSGLGGTYLQLHQYDQAIPAYREALRIRPEDAHTWYALGLSYYRTNKYDQAIQAFREALRIEPEEAGAWFSLGIVYYDQGQRAKVREIYQTLRKLDPAMAEKYFNSFILP